MLLLKTKQERWDLFLALVALCSIYVVAGWLTYSGGACVACGESCDCAVLRNLNESE